MHVRICRECGEEFRPEIVVCSDCGGVLEDRHIEEDPGWDPAPGVVPAPFHVSPAEARPLYQGSTAQEIEPAARALGEREIPFVVQAASQSFALMVAEEDLERATAVLRELGLLGGDASPEAPSQCPACGTALKAGASECPECGLVVGGGED